MSKSVELNISKIEVMSNDYANEIAYKWKYRGRYAFYNIMQAEQELKEFLNKELHKSTFYAVLGEKEELIGFYSYAFENDIMWIGLGLKPKLTGKGFGKSFMQRALEFGISEFNYAESKILLTVAEFNKRAIHLYESFDFTFVEKKDFYVKDKIYPHWVMGKQLNTSQKTV